MSDPKLKGAMEEIKAVLKKHDIAGVVLIQSPGYSEFLFEIQPSWSCARVEGHNLRFRSMAGDYPTLEAKNFSQQATVGMIMGFLDHANYLRENMEKVGGMLAKHMQFSHISKREFPT